MVKIKDFTLASKNLGGGGHVPPVPYTPPAHVQYTTHLQVLLPRGQRTMHRGLLNEKSSGP